MLSSRLRFKTTIILIMFTTFFISACGFQLRGQFHIPGPLQTLKIMPDCAYDNFQRILRRTLKNNCVTVVGGACELEVNTLTILSQKFIEQNLAYGRDLQVNRILLQLQIKYQITDPACNALIPESTIQVERELTVNPNAVLGSDHERHRVQLELYNDAAIQILRQLSVAKLGCCES